MRATVTGPGTVEIRYDLKAPRAGLAFDVGIVASEDGGVTFPIKLSSVTGDAGPAVMAGAGKRVVWNAARDVERAAFDKFQYRITATAIPPATLPRPSGTSSSPAPAQPSGGGGGKKWLLIGGGVAAAGAAAAVAGGGGGGSTPSVPAPQVGDVGLSGATDVLLATANAVTFTVSATAQGESLTAAWAFGDGSSTTAALVNGTASAAKNYATAGTFTARVTVTGSRGGSTSRDYRALTVATATGRWVGRFTNISGNFALNLTQNGSQLAGDGADDFSVGSRNSTISGSVSGPPSAMRFKLSYSDGFYEVDVTGSSDQRTFTGTITGARSNPFVMTRQ